MWQCKLVSELEGGGKIDRMSETDSVCVRVRNKWSSDQVSSDLVIKGSSIKWSSNQRIK